MEIKKAKSGEMGKNIEILGFFAFFTFLWIES
jgi:hypothetical protein